LHRRRRKASLFGESRLNRAFPPRADTGIVGRNIILNGKPYSVVGVMQREFTLNNEVMQTVGGNERSDIYVPLPLDADAVHRRGDENYNLAARLKPGVSMPRRRPM
jgi:hypothetical protein